MKELLGINLMQLAGSALLCALVLLICRKRLKLALSHRALPRAWDVYEKKGSFTAFPTGGDAYSLWVTLGYAIFFQYLLPVWLYRWGLFRAIGVIAAPFAVTFLLATFVLPSLIPTTAGNPPMEQSSMFIAGVLLQIPVRVAFAFYVGSIDVDMCRKVHLDRKWRIVHSGLHAKTSIEAIAQFKRSVEQPRKPSLHERLAAKLFKFRWPN